MFLKMHDILSNVIWTNVSKTAVIIWDVIQTLKWLLPGIQVLNDDHYSFVFLRLKFNFDLFGLVLRWSQAHFEIHKFEVFVGLVSFTEVDWNYDVV